MFDEFFFLQHFQILLSDVKIQVYFVYYMCFFRSVSSHSQYINCNISPTPSSYVNTPIDIKNYVCKIPGIANN